MKNFMFYYYGRLVLIIILCTSLVISFACTNPQPENKPHITIGIQLSPAMSLVMVAKDKGCFEQEGLDVELKGFTAGKFALQAFLGGSLDFAVAGEVPATLSTLQGNKFLILSQVVERTINEVRVVARSDEGISDAASYFKKKKRKLATSFGGGPEFFTYSFLKQHGISKEEVEIISQKPEDMPAALENGSVDAISIFDPFAFIAEKKMGDKGVTFADPNIYSELYVLVATEDMTKKNRVTVDKLLRALIKAEQLIKENPEEAKTIVSRYTKLDKDVIDGIWKNFVFAPTLNTRLIDYQNQEAAWAKEKGDIPAATQLPDFRNSIFAEALKSIKPEAVQLQ